MTNRIAIVCFKYPPVYSGYGKQLKLITENVVKSSEDIEITVLTAYEESFNQDNPRLCVKSLLGKNDENSKSVFPFSIKVFKWLWKHRKEYDAIHCVKAGPEAIACNCISKILKKPLLVKIAQDELSPRELKSAKGIKRITRTVRQNFLKTSDNFIAISKEIFQNLRNLGIKADKIVSIPNGVNTIQFSAAEERVKKELREELSIANEEIVLLFVGAINKRKGVYDLLEALSFLDFHVPFRCVLCGPVLEDIDFEKKIENLNRERNVTIDFRGKVQNVIEYMQAADIFILPSYSEGLPNVLLEAGATGLPLIATDIGGSRDLVSKKNGILVTLGSSKEIKEAIDILITDNDKRKKMGIESRKLIEKNYSLDKVTESYINLYKNLS